MILPQLSQFQTHPLKDDADQRTAFVANSTSTILYWHPGQRLPKKNLQNERARVTKTNAAP